MKLYYMPGACSLAVHVALREVGASPTLVRVDPASRRTEDGRDFREINPKGYVPALELDDGEILTEGAVLLQYLADRYPDVGLAPKYGTFERYRLMEMLHFLATEVHKAFGPLWQPDAPDAMRKAALENLHNRFSFLDRHLAERPWLMGERFSAPDCYLGTLLRWTRHFDLDLGPWPRLAAYLERFEQRPSVQAALAAEGLA